MKPAYLYMCQRILCATWWLVPLVMGVMLGILICGIAEIVKSIIDSEEEQKCHITIEAPECFSVVTSGQGE